MPKIHRPLALCLGVACAVLAGGCAESPPPLTVVEGTLLLNDQPLPQALVRFVPDTPGPGATLIATGITDDKGHFRLVCDIKNEPGAAVGKNRVIVTDAPPPAGARGQGAKAQATASSYFASLKNRPIPQVYGTAAKTTVVVEVKQDQKEYTIKLTR